MKEIEHRIINGVDCKHCSKCNAWKPLSEFCNDKSRKDGLYCRCKECNNKISKENYNKNSQKIKDRTKKYHSYTLIGRACKLVGNYNWMDKKAGREQGDLTPQWVVENIFSKPCAHCGKTGWNVIGCNRLDNSKPHTKDNVEPCCEHCNHVLGGKVCGIPVDQIDIISGEIIKHWENARVAADEGGFNESHIRDCCNGKRKTHEGYRWKNTL